MLSNNLVNDAAQLVTLLSKIETQVANIEKGDVNTEIAQLMSAPFSSKEETIKLRTEAFKELYIMLYESFKLVCDIVSQTADSKMLSIALGACSRLNDMLDTCTLNIQKTPMLNELGVLYLKACDSIDKGMVFSNSSELKKLCYNLFWVR